jgi:short-subunit dehydrogenase
MKITLKPLEDQVVIITGATSGIGSMTAKMAAREGARVVAVARNEEALQRLAEEINQEGGSAMYVHADVGREEDVNRIAAATMRTFGTFDTWINHAGILTAGGCLEVSIEDMKQMMNTNFWGVVYGSRIAAQHYKERGTAGAIINVGSFTGDRNTSAIQSAYDTSKQAAQGWTDALRMEVEKEKSPVSVSLIHTARTDSAIENEVAYHTKVSNDRNLIAPEAVAEAILYCAQNPKREMFIGFHSKLYTVLETVAPGLMRVMENKDTDEPSGLLSKNESDKTQRKLEEQNATIEKRQVKDYAKTSKHSLLSTLIVAGLGTGVWMISQRKKLFGF